MKILYVTTIGSTMWFFRSFIKELIDAGNTVDIATNESAAPVQDCYRDWGCRVFQLSCSRSPFSSGNLRAVKEIKKIVSGTHYDIVHCHTPIAAACTRQACRSARKHGTRVIYTAHGFHFYDGAPKKNWMIFYPVEKHFAKDTDVLITINKEDYERAKADLKAARVEYVPGVGIDTARFRDTIVDRDAKRAGLGIPVDAKLLLSVGELNENKNHTTVLKALAALNDLSVWYIVAGTGPLASKLERIAADLDLSDRVRFLGHRDDCAELYKTADLFVHPSFREGLPVALLEACAAGLPAIASDIRGCRDILPPEALFDPSNVGSVSSVLQKSLYDPSSVRVPEVSRFDQRAVNDLMREIYYE